VPRSINNIEQFMDSANSCCGKNSAKRGLCFAEKLLQSWSLRTPIVSKDAVDRGVGFAEKREASRMFYSPGALRTPIVSKDAVDRGVGFTEKREVSRAFHL
jgi:hypothetical protein